ncbi:unnamed protein product [Effrenium voratum]|nr:unnamed protein product [Effrenium voratum]
MRVRRALPVYLAVGSMLGACFLSASRSSQPRSSRTSLRAKAAYPELSALEDRIYESCLVKDVDEEVECMDVYGQLVDAHFKAPGGGGDHGVHVHAVEKAAAESAELEEAELAGIYDYHFAEEYVDAWIKGDSYKVAKKEVEDEVKSLKKGSVNTPAQNARLVQKMWLMGVQALVSQVKFNCANICVMCEPDAEVLETEVLKSFWVTRAKRAPGIAVATLLSPVDAAAGVFTGAAAGLLTALTTGILGGVVAGAYFQGGIGGFLAGTTTFVVTTPFVLAIAEVFLPVMGLFHGAGITQAFTSCGRVGFEAFVQGFKKNYSKDWFEAHATAAAMAEVPAAEKADYKAISHCEFMRLEPFDVRHTAECMKHSGLCGGKRGMVLPVKSEEQCRAASQTPFVEPDIDGAVNMWEEAKRKALCMKKLCQYGGYKKASLKAHPDRTMALEAEERQALEEDFKFLVNCKDDFKTPDGRELTLNAAEAQQDCDVDPSKCALLKVLDRLSWGTAGSDGLLLLQQLRESVEAIYQMFQFWNDAFLTLDTDGDGALSEEEFRSALRETNPNISDMTSGRLFRAADVNQDGFVDVEEFSDFLKAGAIAAESLQ